MTEADLIASFVSPPNLGVSPFKGVSCLWAAVRDARPPSGRDANTGDWDAGRPDRQIFLGAIGYIVAIDLLGKALTLTRGASKGSYRFVDGLHDFMPAAWGLSSKDTLALYALRNAFAHSFSVVNGSSNPDLRHVFAAIDDPQNKLIEYKGQWSGNSADVSQSCETIVNLRKVGDLAEDMVKRAGDLHAQGLVKIRCASLDEFRATYFLSERY